MIKITKLSSKFHVLSVARLKRAEIFSIRKFNETSRKLRFSIVNLDIRRFIKPWKFLSCTFGELTGFVFLSKWKCEYHRSKSTCSHLWMCSLWRGLLDNREYWAPIIGEIVLRFSLFFDFLLDVLSLYILSLDASKSWSLGDASKLCELTACFLELSVSESNVNISVAVKLGTLTFLRTLRFLPPSESSLKGSNSFSPNTKCARCEVRPFLSNSLHASKSIVFVFLQYYRHTILSVVFCDIKFVFRFHR